MTRYTRRRMLPAGSDPGVAAGLVTMLTLATAFGLAALGVEWFWVVFPVGFGGVMPVVVGVTRRHRRGKARGGRRSPGQRSDRSAAEDAALARLREQYVNGTVDEEAFEARLEHLLLTEDSVSARAYAAAGRGARTGAETDGGADDSGRVSGD